jgi:hypothetical protein
VLVDGKAAVSVSLSGHTAKVGLAPPSRIMCDIIGPGTLTIQFARGGDIGSPPRAGPSVVAVAVNNQTFRISFAFSAA